MTRPDPAGVFAWLSARQRFGMKLGLDRMRALLSALGTPQDAFRSVLVGGTNGKGSTAAVLAAVLRAEGERVGLTVSPHLQRLAERVVVDGAAVDDARLAAALERLRPHAERLDATYFEAITAAALTLFADSGVSTAVLEVGMGGRFDATNAVEPVASLITGVALDHTAVLGTTVREIAHEKAGILRPGRPAWTGAVGEARRALTREAAALGAALQCLERDAPFEARSRGWEGFDLTIELPAGRLEVVSPLVGAHQARNVALALAAAGDLGVSVEALRRGAAAARWPGRLERVTLDGLWVVLDGAHNPQAAAALAGALAELEGRVAVLVLGMSEDKDVAAVVALLAPLAERVVVTRALASPRALAPEALADIVRARPGGSDRPEPLTAADPAAALELASELAGEGGTVVVAGSLFLVGETRALVLGEGLEPGERWQ